MESTHCAMNTDFTGDQDLNHACLCVKHSSVTPYDAFFAKTHVFLTEKNIRDMKRCITILEKTVTSETYKKRVFAEAYNELEGVEVSGGVIMSYDFHLDEGNPKLIEINTNAGGLFLNYELAGASRACCKETEIQDVSSFEENIVSMFKEEFAKKSDKHLQTILIIDEHPSGQFLYPEFLMCKQILEKHGLTVFIADPSEVIMKEDGLYSNETKIDLIYNRLTDFYFEKDESLKLLEAEKKGFVTVTPNSSDHKLFAHKSNYLVLRDSDFLSTILTQEELAVLDESIPDTVLVDEEHSEQLWKDRKKYFFKPVSGYGGKGAYNGRGLTKETWEHIKKGGYLAQAIVSANKRITKNGDEEEIYKFDIRAYTYKGKVLLFAARMYQGQTTNFRTIGGGFAPVLITK